mmetsp:Transcript_6047/g.20269  ORF Transcript_6047/g.20269 Transcript_6047/m.20269 type:complete len:224 (-) Transcript_6047:739-1410(-)
MIFSNLPVLSCVSKVEPAPLAQTPSIGHPMLMSMKSHWTSFSISSTHRLTKSGYPPHIWTPNLFVALDSHACLRTSAHSRRSPANKFEAIAISDIVTSAPNFTHMRRNGACPTVVNGAKTNFLLKSIAFFFTVFSSFSFAFASSSLLFRFIAVIFLFFAFDTHSKSFPTISKYFVDLGKRYVDSRNFFCNQSSMALNSSLPSLRRHSSNVFDSFALFSCRSEK